MKKVFAFTAFVVLAMACKKECITHTITIAMLSTKDTLVIGHSDTLTWNANGNDNCNVYLVGKADEPLFLGSVYAADKKFVWNVSSSIPVGSGYYLQMIDSASGINIRSNEFAVVEDTCYKNVVLNGITYSLSPCVVHDTLIDGRGNNDFSTTIVPSNQHHSFGFQVYGYGVGFPTYGIIGVSSGGAWGNTPLEFHFSADVFSPGYYDGYLPIQIFEGSAWGNDSNFLKLKVKLLVK